MPKPDPRPQPEIVSHVLMPGRARDGRRINLGAGVTDRGAIALLNTAPDGIAVLSVEATSDYLGLLRRMLFEAVNQGTGR